ncbi:RHS repeat-associated core domain-containing protein, partial [Lonsdalea quercina]
RLPVGLKRYLGDAANEEVYCELRYQGQIYDAETGLYYNRHRYYDADSGQYISPDPIGLLGGIRPQSYVPNPFCWVDPLGLSKCPEKWDVGSYEDLRDSVKGQDLGLDAHHVGQKAVMKDLVEGYDPKTAPSILVPKEGHTRVLNNEIGVVSRSKINPNTGLPFTSPRDVIARDVRELRRVYSDVPNSKLQELIQLNKDKYPELRIKR